MLENYIPIVIKQDKLTIMKVIDLQIPKQIELPLHLVNSSKKFSEFEFSTYSH